MRKGISEIEGKAVWVVSERAWVATKFQFRNETTEIESKVAVATMHKGSDQLQREKQQVRNGGNYG